MPIVFYYSAMHGLGFFVWWVICVHGYREHRIHAIDDPPIYDPPTLGHRRHKDK